MPKAAAAPAPVKAADLAPQAFSGETLTEDKPDDLQYDLHHLAALDSHPVRRRLVSIHSTQDTQSICTPLFTHPHNTHTYRWTWTNSRPTRKAT